MTHGEALARRGLMVTAAGLVGWTVCAAVVPDLRDRLPALVPTTGVVALGALLARWGRVTLGTWVANLGGGAVLFAAAAATGGHASRLVAYVPLTGLFAVAWSGPRGGLALLAFVCVVSALLPTGLPTDSDADRAVTIAVATVVGASFAGPLIAGLRSASAEAARSAEEAEQEARRALVDGAARDRFLTSVSHELRTPLETVLGYTEFLLEDETDPGRASDLGRVRSAATQLGALVDDLIDMALIDGELSLAFGEVPLGPLVAEVAGTAAPLVERNANRLVLEPSGEAVAWADGRRVQQILLNLLSNAAKYTERGTIAVRVAPSGAGVALEVSDTGIGIPSHRMSEMFQPFVQLHQGTERRAGVGLGLALSQRLAQRMGGRLTARSVEGAGSVFTLWLPRLAAPGQGVGE
jgi:signal transduction histidine kinase